MTKIKFEKVLLIVNPKAGQGDLHTNLTKIVPPLAAAFPDLHILHTKNKVMQQNIAKSLLVK